MKTIFFVLLLIFVIALVVLIRFILKGLALIIGKLSARAAPA